MIASCSLAGKFFSLAIACSSSLVIAINRYQGHTINYLCLHSVEVLQSLSIAEVVGL